MAAIADLPEIIKDFTVGARLQDKSVKITGITLDKSAHADQFIIQVEVIGDENIRSLGVRVEGLTGFLVCFLGQNIPLADFDWSWKARFGRIRQFMGHSYEKVSELTGDKSVSLQWVVSSKDFPPQPAICCP
jgi:hypothetical protein